MSPTFRAIVVPALHTFWQFFAGLVAAWWLASGLTAVHQVTDVASAKRFALAALGAVLAAALSAAMHTVQQYAVAGKIFDPTAIDVPDGPEPADLAAAHAALKPVTPADPDQPAAGVPHSLAVQITHGQATAASAVQPAVQLPAPRSTPVSS